jgi:hypothetical protein
MKKYINRIYNEADKEFYKPYRKNLPLIEAIAVMVIISRAMAESVEIFPYSVNKFLVNLANTWAYFVAPLIDRIYGSLGYPFAPDVALLHKLPPDNPIYPLPVWMVSLWTFSVLYTFAYWLVFTSLTYGIGKLLGGNGSFIRLLTWTGIAHIAMINWWFYVGCEMMYEIVRQEVYLSLFPPYHASTVKTKVPTPWGYPPNFVPIEGFWVGFMVGTVFLILTAGLIYGFTKRELNLNPVKALVAVTPWLVYLAFVFTGSLNVDEIMRVLHSYVERGDAWSWGR